MIDVKYIENPKGLDKVIQKVQKGLQKLVTWNGYKAFGRSYRLGKEDKIMPCLYIRNGEYYEILSNDKEIAYSFFDVISVVEHSTVDTSSCEIDLIYFANVERIYPELKHRTDEDVISDVLLALDKIGYGIDVISHNTINPLDSFDYDKNIAEMHPFLVFSVKLKVRYNYTNC